MWDLELTKMHEMAAGRFHPIDVASRKLAVESMQAFQGRAARILDIGCGSGWLVADLRAALPSAQVDGADYWLPEGSPFQQFDITRCPLADHSLDGITSLNVLEHIEDDAQALREMRRILRPGGIAHIEVPACPSLFDAYDTELGHHRRYTMSGLKRLARESGFIVERATHLGAVTFPFFVVAKRFMGNSPASKIAVTRQSTALKLALKAELALGTLVRYPVGIRCVVRLR